MSPRRVPTPEDAGRAVELLLGALESGTDIAQALGQIHLLHPKNDTFPGEVFMRLAASAMAEAGVGPEAPISEHELVVAYLPEYEFFGRENRKIRYAVVAAAATHGGVELDLLDEIGNWRTDDFWRYSALAAVAWIRAIADRRGLELAALCGRLRASSVRDSST